jgi:hypothetical protein
MYANILDKHFLDNGTRDFLKTARVIIVSLWPFKVNTSKNICIYLKRVASSTVIWRSGVICTYISLCKIWRRILYNSKEVIHIQTANLLHIFKHSNTLFLNKCAFLIFPKLFPFKTKMFSVWRKGHLRLSRS